MEQRITQLAGEDRGREGLTGTRGADQQQFAPWREPVVLEFGHMALFADDPLEPVLHLRGRDQVGQAELGCCRVQQPAAVLEALGDRNRVADLGLFARLLDDIAQLLRELAVCWPKEHGLSASGVDLIGRRSCLRDRGLHREQSPVQGLQHGQGSVEHPLNFASGDEHLPALVLGASRLFQILAIHNAQIVGDRMALLEHASQEIRQVSLLLGYMNQMYNRLGLPEEMNERVSQEVAQLVECSLR